MAGTSLQHKDNKKLYCPKILKPKMQKPSKKPKKTKKTKKTIFQRSWNRGPPQRVCKYCFVWFFCFFCFFQCFFGFSLRGPPQRVCKYCFFCFFLYFLVFSMFFWTNETSGQSMAEARLDVPGGKGFNQATK